MKRIATAILIVAFAAAALAQETEQQKKTRLILESERVTVNVRDMLVSTLVREFQILTEVKISIDDAVCKKLTSTLDIKHVPAGEALNKTLKPHNLGYIIRKDGTIFISTEGKIAIMKVGKSMKVNELLVILRNGTKLKGKVNINKWNLNTAYGNLAIPSSDIRAIWPGKKQEETREEDKVETVRFTVTGMLQIDKLEVDTGKGKLSIPASDIKEILFPGMKPVKPMDEKILRRTKADIKAIEDGIELFKGDTGAYPSELEDLIENPSINGWSGPYLKRLPIDAWGRTYMYKKLNKSLYPYELKTFGADGKPGGEGENKDLSNLDAFKGK